MYLLNGIFPAIFPNHTIIIIIKAFANIRSVYSVNNSFSVKTIPTTAIITITKQKTIAFFKVLVFTRSSETSVKSVIFLYKNTPAPSENAIAKQTLIYLFCKKRISTITIIVARYRNLRALFLPIYVSFFLSQKLKISIFSMLKIPSKQLISEFRKSALLNTQNIALSRPL